MVYAVIDLESGHIDYANAGHNPPLVVRDSRRCLESLARTGMALGVLPHNPIESGWITLEEGDFLVLYTDGITEAFSPQGNLYGDQGIRESIETAMGWEHDPQAHQQVSAQALLETIDSSVNQFIGEAPLSDDLTLVVIKRLADEGEISPD